MIHKHWSVKLYSLDAPMMLHDSTVSATKHDEYWKFTNVTGKIMGMFANDAVDFITYNTFIDASGAME